MCAGLCGWVVGTVKNDRPHRRPPSHKPYAIQIKYQVKQVSLYGDGFQPCMRPEDLKDYMYVHNVVGWLVAAQTSDVYNTTPTHRPPYTPPNPNNQRTPIEQRPPNPSNDALAGYISLLKWCDALVLVYPTWWYGQPAILKVGM